MSTTTFENAKVGDKVWDYQYGWGEVYCIRMNIEYPLEARFGDLVAVYTMDGKQYTSDTTQRLFWDEIKFEAPTQPPRMKLINGIKVPDITFNPEYGQQYYFPIVYRRGHYSYRVYVEDYEEDEFYVENNLCYPFTEEGKQAAILHAKAMLGIKE